MPQGHVYNAERITELAERIVRYRRLYEAGTPEVSDSVYDQLEDELRRLAPHHPALQIVGGITAVGKKVPHEQPMLSLQKTYDRGELLSWMGPHALVGTAKVDGVSMSLIYDEGRLVLAKTRGNGYVGEDVTNKLVWVADVLPQLDFQACKVRTPHRLEIRGELYCTESQFVRLSDQFVALGLDRPTSARNIVAGLLGRKTHIELARYFNFFAFNIVDPEAAIGATKDEEQIACLKNLGFRLPFPQLIENAVQLDEFLETIRQKIEDGEIGIDGAVFSFNDLHLHAELGNTSHHPRYKMSFKWQGQTAVTEIKDVFWATSRLGIVTPVAVVDPVFLSGAKITNVTLHNAAHVRAYNLKKADRIEIVRSGEVIPKFLVVTEAAEGQYSWPSACPSCHTQLEFDDVRLKCPNTLGCPAQQLGVIINWIRAAQIDDLSEKRLLPLIEQGLVRTMADLYKLNIDDFYAIPQTKAKMANKLYQNIQNSRSLPLAAFLSGLGIEGAGLTTWEKLLEVFPSLEALLNAQIGDIQAVDGFAEKTAKQIVMGLKAKRSTIDALLAVGVSPRIPDVGHRGEGPLAGKTLVITGALSRPRSEIERDIKAAGGKLASSVSANTHAVVTDDPTADSSKMKKARLLNIKVWSESDLEQVLHT